MNETEWDRRRGKYAQIRGQWLLDAEAQEGWAESQAGRAPAGPKAIAVLDQLGQTGDLHAFAKAVRSEPGFPGHLRQGAHNTFLVGIAKNADGTEASEVVEAAYRAPTSDKEAAAKVDELVALAESLGSGRQPAPGMAPLAASCFWELQDQAWAPLWASAEQGLRRLGWYEQLSTPSARYLGYRSVLAELSNDPLEAATVLSWLNRHPFVGLDPCLIDRCGGGAQLVQGWTASGGYTSPQDEEEAQQQAVAIIAELNLVGEGLEDRISATLGRSLKLYKLQTRIPGGPFRHDGYVVWSAGRIEDGPGMRVWATADGVAVGMHPGFVESGWYQKMGLELRDRVPEGMQFMVAHDRTATSRLEQIGADYESGEFMIGNWFPGETALDRVDFAEDIVAATATLQPLFDHIVQAAGGRPPPVDDDPLTPLVERFRAERPYPSGKDDAAHEDRVSLAAALSADGLAAFDLDAFRQVINTKKYGNPGPQSVLNSSLSAMGAAELESFAESIHHLLWFDEPEAPRIDRLLNQEDLGTRGLGESVMVKLLAIAHPDRFIPVFPYLGDMGKVRMMQLLEIEAPDPRTHTRGELQVAANDLIRDRLDQFFPGDPWGLGQFLYWWSSQPPAEINEVDVLGELAGELLVERAFLEELVELIEDKGQIILYGPPGTGKTYLAKKLAAALAPDPKRRTIVQFHPSTSYEDFFEGYRPDIGPDGQMTYRLTPGPLAILAERAETAAGVDHYMVIDEINRANLPKVFGELLFLLEYRDEAVRTLYRPDDVFELPENLKFIGTMNTADRSIALIDAAMRRRFHFIPFFPQEGPMAGLLGRWLHENGGPEWVAELVEMVNTELYDRLGGPHLQIGPSHFMTGGLDDETKLRRIWTYNVYPYIEEQLFGELAEINRYTWDAVRARFEGQTSPDEIEAQPGDELHGPEAL